MNNSSVQHNAISVELVKELVDIQEITPTGSSFTCDPPVTDTDIDFVVKVHDLSEFLPVAMDLGWDLHGEQEKYRGDEGMFKSLRRENINLIATESRVFFERYKLATELAKQFNLLQKKDRIDLFHAV